MYHLLRAIKSTILTALLIVVVVCALPPFLIILQYRTLVWALAKCFRNLNGFVTGPSSCCTLFRPEKASISMILCPMVRGVVQLETLQDLVQKRLLNAQTYSGEMIYSRLKQHWVSFMGYSFWAVDPNFELRNHVRKYDFEGRLALPSPCYEKDLKSVLGPLAEAPWRKDRSPWEWLLVSNYYFNEEDGEEKTAILVRCDHMLADGYSALEAMKTISRSPFTVPRMGFQAQQQSSLSFWEILGAVLKLPYDFADNVSLLSYGAYKRGHRKGLRDKGVICSLSTPVPVEFIKSVKNHFSTHYSLVLNAAVYAAIGRLLEDEGKVPGYLTSCVVLPKPKHPGGTVNHVRMILVKWPVQASSPESRLKGFIEASKHLTSTTAPLAHEIASNVIGLLPTFLKKLCVFNTTAGISMLSTCFPVTTGVDHLIGHEVVDMIGYVSTWCHTGISVTMAGVNNKQRVVFAVDSNVASNCENIEGKLGRYFDEELHKLSELVAV